MRSARRARRIVWSGPPVFHRLQGAQRPPARNRRPARLVAERIRPVRGRARLAGRDEAEVYTNLGFPFDPPKLCENRGEIEAGGIVPDLLSPEDILADLHAHTTASDGHLSIEGMVAAAASSVQDYLAITDHSRSSVIAGGLTAEHGWSRRPRSRR